MKSRKRHISKITLCMRHAIVKRLAPKIYFDAIHRVRLARFEEQYLTSVPRPSILFVEKNMNDGRPLTGAEIGIAEGSNAENILETLNMRKLYLIDPYEPYFEDKVAITGYVDKKEAASKRLAKFGDKVKFLYMRSQDATSHIPTNLDFVYIDGCHAYESVKYDIENYFPKLRDGGVICGHDFTKYWLGVIRAVCEFTVFNRYQLMIERGDWWIVKGTKISKRDRDADD